MTAVRTASFAISHRAKNEERSQGVLLAPAGLLKLAPSYLLKGVPSSQLLQESDLLEVVRSKKERDEDALPTSQSSAPEVILRRNDFRSSTKLDALVANLRMSLIISS